MVCGMQNKSAADTVRDLVHLDQPNNKDTLLSSRDKTLLPLAMRGRDVSILDGVLNGTVVLATALFGTMAYNWATNGPGSVVSEAMQNFLWGSTDCPVDPGFLARFLSLESSAIEQIQPHTAVIAVGSIVTAVASTVFSCHNADQARKEVRDSVTKGIDESLRTLNLSYFGAIAAGRIPTADVKKQAQKILDNLPQLTLSLKDVKCLSDQEIIRITTVVTKECQDILNHRLASQT